MLVTERPSHLRDHAGQIAFPGGKIDALDTTPLSAALREAEEEIGLDGRFIEPIGYLDVHATPSGFRILPVVALVGEGFSLRINSGEVTNAFEVPLAFLMAPQNYQRETAQWNALSTTVSAISFNGRKIWASRLAYSAIFASGFTRIRRLSAKGILRPWFCFAQSLSGSLVPRVRCQLD